MKINLPTLTCLKCGHIWHPRKPHAPKVCPICKRHNWQEKKAS